jgi:hypothetical protein
MATITERTRKMLWGRSGGLCAICRVSLFETGQEAREPTVLGQECHIVGEENSAGSPRGFDPMPLELRNLYTNLVLLCGKHHKIIDDRVEEYTIEILRKIKLDHELWVQQSLRLDLDKQLDDERYMQIAEMWSALAGLDDWANFTYSILSGDPPTVNEAHFSRLNDLQVKLLQCVYPQRYQQLNKAFHTFRVVLHDFLNVFNLHAELPSEGISDLRTRRFYRNSLQNRDLYNRQLQEYLEHVNLLCDLAVELTRAANFVCESLRTFVYQGYRVSDGWLLCQTGPGIDGQSLRVQVRYTPDEQQQDSPYPGLERFTLVRTQRGFHYGPSIP